MIIAVSDIHLGDLLSNRTGFIKFINEFIIPRREEITHLVLLGDIFDLWRGNNASIIRNHKDILSTLDSQGFNIYYVVGNHDFTMTEPHTKKLFRKKLPNITFCREWHIESGGTSFRFIHGHQINYWYALPFYETFSKAMCDTEGQHSKQTDVWDIISEYSDISPELREIITSLPQTIRNRIISKLAGPLEGPARIIGEAYVEEMNLLKAFIQKDHLYQLFEERQVYTGINETLRNLSLENNQVMRLDSMTSLWHATQNIDSEELKDRFLEAWMDCFNFISESTGKHPIRDRQQLLQYIRRMAAMLTAGLQYDEFLIHGHGHESFANRTTRTADAGCWIRNRASFISIKEGDVVYNRLHENKWHSL